MAGSTAQQLGIKAPKGGFTDNGWFDGYNYDAATGTFGAKGQNWAASNPDKSKSMVSAEVNAQSAKAQGVSTENFNTFLNAPSSQNGVTPFLNDFQSSMFNSSGAPEVRVQTPEEVKTQLQPSSGLPPLLNRMEEFDKLRTTHNVADLEQKLNEIKGEEDNLIAAFRQQKATEEGKPVSLNVISGRVSEEERAFNERVDVLGRNKSRLVDELNTKYSLINTYMNFMGLDYQDAVARYDTEYKQNLDVYNIIDAQKKTARAAWEYDQTAAKANLQVFMSAITSGNLSYSNMSSDQKLMVNKLEVQAGLPIGFIGSLNMSPKDRLLSINEKTGEALVVGDNGSFQVIQTGLSGTGTGGGGGTGSLTETQMRSATSTARTLLSKIDSGYQTVNGKLQSVDKDSANPDKRISLQEYQEAAQQLMSSTGLDISAADGLLTSAMRDMGYSKWKW